MYNDKWFIMDEEEIKQPPKSKRDIVIERLRAKYPDSPLEGDEDIFEMIDTDYSANESREAERKANNDKLSNLFMKNPRFGAFFMELLSVTSNKNPSPFSLLAATRTALVLASLIFIFKKEPTGILLRESFSKTFVFNLALTIFFIYL